MIFETLRKHAEYLKKKNAISEVCFVLKSCRINKVAFSNNFLGNLYKEKPSKSVFLPILFVGKREKAIAGRFQGSNSGNASNNTFKKVRKPEMFPEDWFPWLTGKGVMDFGDFIALLDRFNDEIGVARELENRIRSLFRPGGPLYTFVETRKGSDVAVSQKEMLGNQVSRSVYQVVTCNKPTLAVHSVLALNALAVNSHLYDLVDGEQVPFELLKFSLLFWMLDEMKSLKLSHPDSDDTFGVVPQVNPVGNVGNIEKLPLLLDAGVFRIGEKVGAEDTPSDSVIRRFLELTREDRIDRIVLGRNVVYSAPATGKTPTNPFRVEGENVLSPQVMLGFDPKSIWPIIEGYTRLVQDHAFNNISGAIKYYIFPEEASYIENFLEKIGDTLSRLKRFRKEYFDEMGKSVKTAKASERKKEILERIHSERQRYWQDIWPTFRMNELIFAFEENVGSSNQAQMAWTAVYRKIPSAIAFLFLAMVDDPSRFGRLIQLLKRTGFNLGEEWAVKEIKRMFDRYFNGLELEQLDHWSRWRRYLIRSNRTEDPISPKLWENAMAVILEIAAMRGVESDEYTTGGELLNELERRRSLMQEKNQDAIAEYLSKLFVGEKGATISENHLKKMEDYVVARGKDYAAFVDTESDKWKPIVEGLLCGSALKRICLKLREDDYKSVIGGKNLAKQSPGELRTLSVNLLNKAERAGSSPWNVQVPLELMFKWSQKSAHGSDAVLFMDSVSLGFLRYETQTQSGNSRDDVEKPKH